jgi:prepilin-type N-terminal cleavage/methylation domain-containing protein
MLVKKIDNIHKGFSLIELLIVIIIISIVYFLGFSSIEKASTKKKALSPLNLKSTILKSELFQGEATLMCINKCRSCYIRKDISSPFEEYEQSIDLKNIEAYTLDSRDSLHRREYGRYHDEKICLMLNFYTNGSSTQIILKKEDRIYFLPAFFDEPQEVANIEEAKELWLKNAHLVSNSGDFY